MRLDCGGMEFEKLADLLELGQFELISLPEGEAGENTFRYPPGVYDE